MARVSPSLVVSIVALIVALAGVGVAAIPSSDGTITGCFASKTGALRVVDEKKKCRRGEKRIAWNQRGQPGTPGEQGPAGPQGAQGVQGPKGDQGAPGSDAQFNGAAAGGDLSGTYPNPVVAPNAIGGSEVSVDSLTGADLLESTLVGVDADRLDGLDSNAFASAGHNHDAAYVNEGQANGVSAGMIVDPLRSVPVPLTSVTDCDAATGRYLAFVDDNADSAPVLHQSAAGRPPVIRFDSVAGAADEDHELCTQLTVPPDFASGAALRLRVDPGAVGTNTENIECSFNATAFTAVTVTGIGEASYSCPVTVPLSPGGRLAVAFRVSSPATMDTVVDVLSIDWTYTAAQ